MLQGMTMVGVGNPLACRFSRQCPKIGLLQRSTLMSKQVSGLLNTALFCVVIMLQVTNIALEHGVAKGFETLDHIGSFLGGIAGLTAAGIALLGFNVWKHQITHGKYLTLIWEAMVAVHRLESHMSIFTINLIFRHQHQNLFFAEAVEADRATSEKLIATLKESCSAIDVIAARNGVELSNICGFMESRLMVVNRFVDTPSDSIEPQPVTEWTLELSALMEPAHAEASLLKGKLATLEARYS